VRHFLAIFTNSFSPVLNKNCRLRKNVGLKTFFFFTQDPTIKLERLSIVSLFGIGYRLLFALKAGAYL
jgi:hypothetical protein